MATDVESTIGAGVRDGCTLVTTLSSALVPAWQGSALEHGGALKERPVRCHQPAPHARAPLAGRRPGGALAHVVGVGGAVPSDAPQRPDLDPGFSTRNGLSARRSPAGRLRRSFAAPHSSATSSMRVREIPGVQAATVGQTLPLNLGGGSTSPSPSTATPRRRKKTSDLFYNRVGSDYLRTMGIRPVEGRDSHRADISGKPKVGIINETMARRYWAGRSAVGGRIRLGRAPSKSSASPGRQIQQHHRVAAQLPVPAGPAVVSAQRRA